ncbi:MAG: ABC transporter ATP-binding protein [Bacteroidia bacterium]|nr:ABC transporter ATP-binding protein [Bacteroidia bacterium]
MPGLSLQNIKSGYDDKLIVKNLSLDVEAKETLVLMGSSGSGKSTLLLTILGILKPSHGKIILNDKEITNLPIESRNIGYLPQDYGLFPHMSVIDNVSYGLRMRGIQKKEYESSAEEILELVELKGYGKRKPKELSGGERQRVGLARALAIKPDLFLLDEPLSNIDQATKMDVAKQMKELFRKLEIPIILVTHNHEDALFLAERLAIMIDGKIEQVGSVDEVLKNPKTKFIKRLLMPFAEG